MRRRAAVARVCAVLVATACAEREPGFATSEVRDSAGVRIVESRLSREAVPVLVLSAEPLAEIGVLDGAPEYQLDRVQWATRLSDGSIVVANGGSGELRIYDRSGVHVRTGGGTGAGPGEYRSISYLRRLAGDTLLVFDALNRRISLLDPSAWFVRAITQSGDQPLRIAAALEDGTFLSTRGSSGIRGAAVAFVRDTAAYDVVRGEERLAVELAYPGGERHIRISERAGEIASIEVSALPFARNVLTSATSDHFIIGSNYSYEVHLLDRGGALRTIIRRTDVVPEPVTTELVDRFIEDRLERQRAAGRPPDEVTARRQLSSMPRVEAMPAYTQLLGAQDGTVWVQDWVPPWEAPPTHRWTVFEPDGTLRGVVHVPADLRPLYIDRDVVIGVRRDEFDVEYVRSHALERTRT